MVAVCIKCGGSRARYDEICPSCGFRPTGEGLLVAWLLSSAHLDEEGLAQAAARIQSGQSVQPSQRMLDQARRALGVHASNDPGLSRAQVLQLLVTNLFITSLIGWVFAFWWRQQRPRSALQAFAVTLPCTVLYIAGMMWWILNIA